MTGVPPLLAGATLVFWGWQVGLPWIGVAIAALIEGARLAAARLEPDARALGRLRRAVLVGALVMLVAFAAQGSGVATVMRTLKWLPAVLAALAVVEAWSAPGTVGIARMAGIASDRAWHRASTLWPYLAVTVIAAASANRADGTFYPGVVALGCWALWGSRPRGAPLAPWIGLLAIAAAIGHGGHIGLRSAQSKLVQLTGDWLVGDLRDPDPYRSATAIGHIGELKQDGAVILRLRPMPGTALPELLRRAQFDRYSNRSWLATDARLEPMAPARDGVRVLDEGTVAGAVAIEAHYAGERAVLALPPGLIALEGPPGAALRRNRLGVIEAHLAPGHHRYVARFDAARADRAARTRHDLAVPEAERSVLEALADELGLRGLPPVEAARAVRAFFARDFRYSLYRADDGTGATGQSPLTTFLTRDRHGHCEYFATATVLLLRVAGVPARYATGYAVQEWSALEQALVVRRRHAHAWARAWLDGRWVAVDTTPAIWLETERRAASWLEPLADLLGWAARRLAALRAALPLPGGLPGATWVVALPALAWLAWLLARRAGRRRRPGPKARDQDLPGATSPFYRVERHLAAKGCERTSGEPILSWIERLAAQDDAGELRALARLHYRLRFDPDVDAASVRAQLERAVQAWLADAKTPTRPRSTA